MSTVNKTYSNLPQDSSSKSMQTGGGISTIDGDSNTSPLVISTSITTLVYPENSPEVVIEGSVALRYSEDETMTRYSILAANTKMVVPGGYSRNLYIRTGSGAGVLYFHFITV